MQNVDKSKMFRQHLVVVVVVVVHYGPGLVISCIMDLIHKLGNNLTGMRSSLSATACWSPLGKSC